MSNGENGETLAFRDLSAEEVYHLAHLENDTRSQAAKSMGDAAFGTAKDIKERGDQAGELIANQNERDYEWLADLAAVRGVLPEIPIKENPALWLRIQLRRTGATNRQVAKELGVSEGHMSAFVKGRRDCPEELQSKLKVIFSEIPTA